MSSPLIRFTTSKQLDSIKISLTLMERILSRPLLVAIASTTLTLTTTRNDLEALQTNTTQMVSSTQPRPPTCLSECHIALVLSFPKFTKRGTSQQRHVEHLPPKHILFNKKVQVETRWDKIL